MYVYAQCKSRIISRLLGLGNVKKIEVTLKIEALNKHKYFT